MAPRRRERRPSEASSPAPLSLRLAVSAVLAVPNQAGGLRSTTILPTPIVGRIVGWFIFPVSPQLPVSVSRLAHMRIPTSHSCLAGLGVSSGAEDGVDGMWGRKSKDAAATQTPSLL